MGLEQEIEGIREGIKAGRYPNEAAVSQGIVLRLLHALGWPAYDTQIVWPEYSLSGRRVDFALCHPSIKKPIALVEVKQIGQSDGAERQLFEYAFHDGVPMAILTDGREWNFFLPGEQGDYGERRVYKLDIVERDLAECTMRLQRYLLYSAIASGAAIQAARDDYRNVSRDRQMKAALPTAWAKLVEDEDDMLVEIVADRVESLCGFKPDPDMVVRFLQGFVVDHAGQTTPARPGRTLLPTAQPAKDAPAAVNAQPAPTLHAREQPTTNGQAEQRRLALRGHEVGYEMGGQFHPARNAIDVLRHVFETLTDKDASFPERFSARPHGRSRRYLARERDELYRRLDLCRKYSIQLRSGWWMSTNHSRNTIDSIIQLAGEVAGLQYGQDLIAHLGE